MRAGLQQVGAVDDAQHLADVLLDDQHGQAAGADALHQAEHLLHDHRRQAGGRLVEQQQPRLRHQRAADRAHLLLAARHGAGELAAALAQAGEQVVDEIEALAELRPRGGDEGAHAQVVLHRHAREQAAVLRHVRDAEFDDAVRRRGERGRRLPSCMLPRIGRIRPEITRISVVLPAPFGPITATASPAFTSSETSNSAWKLP